MPVDVTLPSTAARPQKPPGRLLAFWRSFRENRGAVLGLTVVSIVIFIAIFANLLAPHDPFEQFRGFTRLPPIWVEGGSWTYPLGTDALGRDMLSRLMYGSRISRSEEHTSELQSHVNLVCRLLLEKKQIQP